MCCSNASVAADAIRRETIQRRFGAAKREIEPHAPAGFTTFFLINSDLKETIEQAIASVRAALATRE